MLWKKIRISFRLQDNTINPTLSHVMTYLPLPFGLHLLTYFITFFHEECFNLMLLLHLDQGCANHATEGKCFCPPSTAVT